MSYASPQSKGPSKQSHSMLRRIEFAILPATLTCDLDSEITLQCIVTNHQRKPFRIRKEGAFTRDLDVVGTLKADIFLNGKPYLDWKNWVSEGRPPRWKEEHIQTIRKGESYAFDANLTITYPLTQKGTYTLQATFKPEQLIGVKVSKCRPVKSNWVTIVVK